MCLQVSHSIFIHLYTLFKLDVPILCPFLTVKYYLIYEQSDIISIAASSPRVQPEVVLLLLSNEMLEVKGIFPDVE